MNRFSDISTNKFGDVASLPFDITGNLPVQVTSPQAVSSEFDVNPYKFVADLAHDTLRGILRGSGSIVAETQPGKVIPIDQEATAAEKFLFGMEPIPALSTEYGKAKQALEAGGYGKTAPVVAGLATFGGEALNFYAGGGEKKVLETLAKETDPEVISSLLRKIGVGENLIKTYTPDFVKATKPEEVKSFLNNLTEIQKTASAAKGVSETSDITRLGTAKGIEPIPIATKEGIPPEGPTPPSRIIPQPSEKLSYTEKIPPESDPVNKIIQVLQEAKPIRKQQEILYSAERSKRFGAASAVGKEAEGEKGYYAELSKLKGELPKKQFESLREKVSQDDIDSLFKQVTSNPWLKYTDTLSARQGLLKMLEGSVPTKSELGLLNKVFPNELINAILDKRTLWQKVKDVGLQLYNLPRSVMASFDLSFGGRQGIFAAPTFRKEFYSSWKRQFAMFGSQKAYEATMQDVVKNPYFNLAKESGVSFTNTGVIMSQREERFMASWGEKIPLIKQSGRAYTGFANKFRMDIFARMAEDNKAMGGNLKDNQQLAAEVAKYANMVTGRGSLGSLERSAVIMNGLFFSPRLMFSRLSLLNPLYYIKADPIVRKQALSSLLGFVGYVGTTLALAKLAGAEVGIDPRSADFGKIKIGNTRIDIMGGFQQYLRMAGQLITGEYVSSVTGKKITLGEGYKPLTRLDILQRQIESKEAPVLSLITNLLKQKDYQGKPINIPKEVGERFVPMVIQDLYDIAKDNPRLLPVGLLGIFGVGLQTYTKQQLKANRFR